MKNVVYILILFVGSFVFSQSSKDALPQLDLYKITLINQSDSYIKFPTDIGNIEPCSKLM